MPHHCEICDYTFEDGKTLKRHNARLHPSRSQQNIQSKCNLCDYLYYTPEALEKHMDVHRDKPTAGQKRPQEKTYECQVCGSPFSQNVSLQYHMKKYHQSITDHESSASDEETDGGNNSSDSDMPTEPPNCPLIQDTAQNIERHDITDVTLMESESVRKLSNHKEINHGVDLVQPTKPLPIHTKSQTNTTCDFETLKMEVCDDDADFECDEAMATSDSSDINIETEVKCEVEHSDSTEDIEEEDLMSIYQDLNRTHMVNGDCNNIQTENIKTESNNLDAFITHMTEKQAIKHSYIPLTRCDTQGKMSSSVHPHTHQAMQAQISSVQMISTTVTVDPTVENKPTNMYKHLKDMTITELEEQNKKGEKLLNKEQEQHKNMTSDQREYNQIRQREQQQNMTSTQGQNSRTKDCERKIHKQLENMTSEERELYHRIKGHLISAERESRLKKVQERGKNMSSTDYENQREKLRIKWRERRKNLTSEQRENIRIKQRERRNNMTSTQHENARIKDCERKRNEQLKNMTSEERELCLRIKECGSTHYLQLHQYLEQQYNVMEDQKPDHIRQENQKMQAQISSVQLITATIAPTLENKPLITESEEQQRKNHKAVKNMTSAEYQQKIQERLEKRRIKAQERRKNMTSDQREKCRIQKRERRKNMTSAQRENQLVNRRIKDRERLQNMTITQRENKRIRERERRKNSSQFEIQLRNDREWQQNVMEDHTHQENESEDQQRCDVRAAALERKRQKDRERRLNMTEEQKAAKRERGRQRRCKETRRIKGERKIAVLEQQTNQDRMKQDATDCDDQGASSGQFRDGDDINATYPMTQDNRDIFGCSACQFKTVHLNYLLNHLTMEHKELNLITTICKVCGFHTNNSTELETHIATYAHDKCFTCEQCSATFLQPYRLRRHIQSRHGNRTATSKVVCPHCGKQYTAKMLKQHIARMHSTGTYLCNECGKQFSNQTRLNTHIRSNHQEPLSCPQCDFTCKLQQTFQIHMTKHTGQKAPLTCDICGLGRTTPASLRAHMHSHTKSFQCPHCVFACNVKSNLGIHMKRHSNEKAFACDLCDYRAHDKALLLSHKHSKHNIGEVKMHKCTEPGCDYASQWNTSLRFHTLRHHGDGLPYKFHCSHCEFKAYSKKGLRDHILTHTGEKPFECPHCGFRCNVISNLRSHIKTHAKVGNKANKNFQ